MTNRKRKKSTMMRLYGTSEIARALGLTRAAVSNIITRRGDELPEPAAFVSDERHGQRWLWDDDGLQKWMQFHQRPAAAAKPGAPEAWRASAADVVGVAQ